MSTTRTRMLHRVTYGIESGNVSRIIGYTHQQAEKIAREALETTNYKSLAAARRYLDSKRIWYDF